MTDSNAKDTSVNSPREESRPAYPHDTPELGLFDLADTLLKWWKIVVGGPVLAAVVTATISLFLPARYTSTAILKQDDKAI